MIRAHEADQKKKMENESKVNGSKYRKKSHFTIGDNVLIRNYNKSRKFDTLFLQEAFKIIDMNKEGNTVTVQQEGSGLTLCRHPDDLKPLKSQLDDPKEKQECNSTPISNSQKKSSTMMTTKATAWKRETQHHRLDEVNGNRPPFQFTSKH